MKSFKELTENKTFKKGKHKHEHQALSEEMIKYYGKAKEKLIDSLPHKYHYRKVRDAFEIAKGKGIESVNYLLAIIRNLK